MLDNLKLSVTNIEIINRILLHPDFVVCRPKTNYYHSLKHKDFGIKLSLDFRKAMENGNVIGYGHLEINISPHYHYNQYRYNGNDFPPENSIQTIIEILTYLGIKPNEMNALKVVNIEFGLNIIPETDIKNLINGLYFYKKTPFKVGDFPYFKKTDATSYKQIKAYAKGLQFIEFPQYGIHPNTFRFEVKSKQAKNIEKYGIANANDLTKLDIYQTLSQTLLDEWENILLINLEPDFTNLKSNEVQFVQSANKMDFWTDLIEEKHRNTFSVNKGKYYNMLRRNNNLHNLIKLQIIDKLFSFSKCANSTQPTPINTRKVVFRNNSSQLINLESAHLHQCLVTGLDISMQKKGSKYLCFAGLKFYKENEPETYKKLELKYLTEKMKLKNIDRQMYYIAHNIRNTKTNPDHNPKYSRARFEQRNYNRQQLQFQF
ncbi:hypothetical protein CMU02_11875 [Elizabethkingia anophelis]|uniref:hypothetical protein n=1 Tax=Elizabethkingia anophelis TaxID=1117645 RepID=UPI00293D0F32|nr:hypothetical protein [Elizabethkingia anophelis]MDV3905499.1 hypothetical protein [Elizabethkingia anophelis]